MIDAISVKAPAVIESTPHAGRASAGDPYYPNQSVIL